MKKHQKNQNKKLNLKIDEIMLILIVAILAILITIYDKTNKIGEIEAEKITALISDNHPLSFVNNGVINEIKLKEVQYMDYQDVKDSLNIKKDFCIYVEDGDGNIILSKGTQKLNGDGLHCRE